jgi:iron complex outermembrane receptor protein
MKLIFNQHMRGCLFLLFAMFTGVMFAQSSVSGTITDEESGDPLIGASVLVTGTSSGTTTDFDGIFTLTLPAGAESMTVSYTGYSTRIIDIIAGQTVYDLTLSSGELLDEIVVIGYGSVKKSDLTGAVVALTEKDFNVGVITSPEELIQGRAAGVQITQTSGEPGAGTNFRIRGTSSVLSNNNPLFVIDGVPLASENVSASGSLGDFGTSAARNPLNFLNPNDIASIDILKDASATAIYGSRGANGVVIITTKKGDGANGGLTYNFSLGVANIAKRFDLLDREGYLDAYTELNGADAAALLDGGADNDYQDELFRTALTQQHSLGFGGGDESGNYRFSVSYMDQRGIIEESGLKRVTARFNGNRNFINDRLTIATQVTISDVTDDNVPISQNAGAGGDLLGAILKSNPTNPIFNQDGSFFQPTDNTEPTPVAINNLYEGFTNTLRGLANISATLKLTDGLSFKTLYGVDRSASNRVDAFSPALVLQGNTDLGRLTRSGITSNNTLWENYFDYQRDFGVLDFSAILGYSYQQFERSGSNNAYTGFDSDDLNIIINNQASAAAASTGNSFRAVNELQSYFTRVNFDIADKYLFTATVRADGSTRFGSDNRYGVFPSFAFKWRLLEENFVPDAFSTLGLRLGYGLTGNQEFGNNLFVATQRYSDGTFQGNSTETNASSLETVSLRNQQLKWESTSQFNIGLDFGFNDNRISGSLDYYRKNTSDLLFITPQAQPSFREFEIENLDADVLNEGVELSINVVAVAKPNFSWNINFNAGYNNNVVQNFDGNINTGEINGQGLSGAFAQRISEGQPLYAFYLRPFGGFDDEGNSIYPEGDRQQFVDASPLPNLTGGLTNTFTAGNLDLTIFFAGQFGHHVYSNTANAYFTYGAINNGRNVTTDVLGTGEGALNSPDVSTRFLEKADFVRLQNATIGYTVPMSGNVISNLRFTVTGQNLFVITGYSGLDPEVSINKSLNGVPSAGIDYVAFPRARTIVFGMNATF